MKTLVDWLLMNHIELTGSVLGIIYVLLASKQNVWCWLAGILSCGLYIVVFFSSQLYGDMLLQLFYLIMGIYGWYIWSRKKESVPAVPVTRITLPVFGGLLVSIAIMTLGFGYLLTFTDDPIPYWDGFTNALGIAGTWMTARKYLENWLLWIFANLVCVAIYYYKGLYPTMVFYFIMTVLAYRAYFMWQKNFKVREDA